MELGLELNSPTKASTPVGNCHKKAIFPVGVLFSWERIYLFRGIGPFVVIGFHFILFVLGSLLAKEFSLHVSHSNIKFCLGKDCNKPVKAKDTLNTIQMVKTFYNIPVNPKLMWDYSFSEEEFQTEAFFKWYLARVLNQGNRKDLRDISFSLIERYLPTLNISATTRRFWERYFKEIRGRYS
jgi:hypothetical protein